MLFRRVRKEPGPAVDLQVVNGFEEVPTEGCRLDAGVVQLVVATSGM